MDAHALCVWMLTAFVTMTTYCVYGVEITILHTNDIHSRIEEINKYNGQCSSSDSAEGKCYGGMERLKSKIDEMRTAYPRSLLLDGGDQYQGTMYFYVHRGSMLSHFMNVLGYDAMGLGNHEFDLGPSGLEPFVNNATFHVLSCNADFSETPDLSKVKKSAIIKVGGEDIGVIGYTTISTSIISKPEAVTFSDEITAIQTEVDRLVGQGVNKIIAVGHAGFFKDMEIAKKVRGLDLVVGGHSNTFLYTGNAPAHEEPEGQYPTVVTNDAGQNVLVVQDYAYGKYLGFLQVDFSADGIITSWKGNPVLLNSTVPKDSHVTTMIAAYRPKVEETITNKVGVSLVNLIGDRSTCRLRECNMGNMIADAMVQQNMRYADGIEWNHVAIALVNSGGIRASINKGDLTAGDIISVSPFGNTIDITQLTGKVIWDALEYSASNWVETGFGGFLQMSGLRVVYDLRKEPGRRVIMVHALCADCDIPEFQPLVMTKTYKVLMPSFLRVGGDGYDVIKNHVANTHTIGDLDSQLLLDYVHENSPLSKGLDNRIQFLDDMELADYCIAGTGTISATSSLLSVLITNVIVFTSPQFCFIPCPFL